MKKISLKIISILFILIILSLTVNAVFANDEIKVNIYDDNSIVVENIDIEIYCLKLDLKLDEGTFLESEFSLTNRNNYVISKTNEKNITFYIVSDKDIRNEDGSVDIGKLVLAEQEDIDEVIYNGLASVRVIDMSSEISNYSNVEIFGDVNISEVEIEEEIVVESAMGGLLTGMLEEDVEEEQEAEVESVNDVYVHEIAKVSTILNSSVMEILLGLNEINNIYIEQYGLNTVIEIGALKIIDNTAYDFGYQNTASYKSNIEELTSKKIVSLVNYNHNGIMPVDENLNLDYYVYVGEEYVDIEMLCVSYLEEQNILEAIGVEIVDEYGYIKVSHNKYNNIIIIDENVTNPNLNDQEIQEDEDATKNNIKNEEERTSITSFIIAFVVIIVIIIIVIKIKFGNLEEK